MPELLDVYGDNPPEHGPPRFMFIAEYTVPTGPHQGQKLCPPASLFSALHLMNPICATCRKHRDAKLFLCDTCLRQWYCGDDCLNKNKCCAPAPEDAAGAK